MEVWTSVASTQLPHCRVRLDYRDHRPEAVDVLLKAGRRVGAQR